MLNYFLYAKGKEDDINFDIFELFYEYYLLQLGYN